MLIIPRGQADGWAGDGRSTGGAAASNSASAGAVLDADAVTAGENAGGDGGDGGAAQEEATKAKTSRRIARAVLVLASRPLEMKLHEYQAKQIFARYGVPIP